MEVWQRTTLEPSLTYRWAVGPLQLWLRSVGDELHLATERGDESVETHRVVPMEPVQQDVGELDWGRWVVPREGRSPSGGAESAEQPPPDAAPATSS